MAKRRKEIPVRESLGLLRLIIRLITMLSLTSIMRLMLFD